MGINRSIKPYKIYENILTACRIQTKLSCNFSHLKFGVNSILFSKIPLPDDEYTVVQACT